jgi:hypothetical protein
VTILCRPEGAPTPTISWTKNGGGMGLQEDDTTSRIRKLRNGHLHISQLNRGDQGAYSCKAENVHGNAESQTYLSIFRMY